MSDLRKTVEAVLEAWGWDWSEPRNEALKERIEALRQALAQPEQEPVAWVYNGILHEFDPSEFATSEVKPLYTAPPKREWVGLTKEDMPVGDNPMFDTDEFAFGAAWAQAKLKEKNT